jgi:hypothetical protein
MRITLPMTDYRLFKWLLTKTIFYLYIFNYSVNAQITGLTLQANVGAGYTNLSELNNYLNTFSIRKLDEFNVEQSLNLSFDVNEKVRVGIEWSLKGFKNEENSISIQSSRYDITQISVISFFNVLKRKNIQIDIGGGITSSKSTFNYLSTNNQQNPFIVGNTNYYFTMYRYNNLGIKFNLSLYHRLYSSDNGNTLLAGITSGGVIIIRNNEWVNSAGYIISNVPSINDNNTFFCLSVLYQYYNLTKKIQ